MELSQNQLAHTMKRFPEFELSYETISHKKVSSNYNIALAIPVGKKCFAWYTYHEKDDICYMLSLNREKKISKSTIITTDFNRLLSLGTIIYGSYIEDETTNHKWFIIEDIVYYKGIPLKKCKFIEKLHFLKDFMENVGRKFRSKEDVLFALPVMWETTLDESMSEYPAVIPENINGSIPYSIHHIQYRACNEILPYLNVVIARKLNVIHLPASETKKLPSHQFDTIKLTIDFFKPQYKFPSVFQVTADIQFDIYHLFAYGKHNKPVYYNVAYVPNYRSSVFMNGLFRNIRENRNLDYIEESDDEEDFQNMNEDKYVNVEKVLLMECVFNYKFKKWCPVRVVDKYAKVVHIGKLVRDYY
jgi:hypothetical protein